MDQQFGPEKQAIADKIFSEGFAPGYERTYWEGCTHGFAVRGDLVRIFRLGGLHIWFTVRRRAILRSRRVKRVRAPTSSISKMKADCPIFVLRCFQGFGQVLQEVSVEPS